MLTHGPDIGADLVDATGIDTQEELARVLRQLRRRLARQRNVAPLTYRELAARTGWAHGVIGDYFAGKTLPPTDRFDVLVGLLGATPAEQGRLATARDRVEEHRRAHRKSRARASIPVSRLRASIGPPTIWTPNLTRLSGCPSDSSTPDERPAESPPDQMDDRSTTLMVDSAAERVAGRPAEQVDRMDAEDAFVTVARRVGWATITMVDLANRPWSRVIHPIWERRPVGLIGWVFARSSGIRRSPATHSPFVSLSYWHPTHDTAIAQCAADWADDEERRRVWILALRTPPPAGYDPSTGWPAGPDCALLRLRPWRLMLLAGAVPTVWTAADFRPEFVAT